MSWDLSNIKFGAPVQPKKPEWSIDSKTTLKPWEETNKPASNNQRDLNNVLFGSLAEPPKPQFSLDTQHSFDSWKPSDQAGSQYDLTNAQFGSILKPKEYEYSIDKNTTIAGWNAPQEETAKGKSIPAPWLPKPENTEYSFDNNTTLPDFVPALTEPIRSPWLPREENESNSVTAKNGEEHIMLYPENTFNVPTGVQTTGAQFGDKNTANVEGTGILWQYGKQNDIKANGDVYAVQSSSGGTTQFEAAQKSNANIGIVGFGTQAGEGTHSTIKNGDNVVLTGGRVYAKDLSLDPNGGQLTINGDKVYAGMPDSRISLGEKHAVNVEPAGEGAAFLEAKGGKINLAGDADRWSITKADGGRTVAVDKETGFVVDVKGEAKFNFAQGEKKTFGNPHPFDRGR